MRINTLCMSGCMLLCLLAVALPAHAKSTVRANTTSTGIIDRFSVELPFQVNLVGLSFGLQPELLFRPISADSGLHLRAAIGLYGGPEMIHFAPLALGLRWVWLRNWRFQPFLGIGVVWQTFLPFDAEAHNRIDMTIELGFRIAIAKGFSVGINLSPEIGLLGITGAGLQSAFGLGLATRLTVTKDLPW